MSDQQPGAGGPDHVPGGDDDEVFPPLESNMILKFAGVEIFHRLFEAVASVWVSAFRNKD